MRGATISRLDVYLDDRFMQTLYQPEQTRISLQAGKHVLNYDMPRSATLRMLLEGMANAINADPAFTGPDGVSATVSLNTSSVQLAAARRVRKAMTSRSPSPWRPAMSKTPRK